MSADPFYEALGVRIAAQRTRLRLSQDGLAKKAGIATSYLNRIESGLRRPTLDVLRVIADALDVRLADLLLDAPAASQPRKRHSIEEVVVGLRPEDLKLLIQIARRLRQ